MAGSASATGPLRVVHVTGDHPDSFEPAKTRAVETLVRLLDEPIDGAGPGRFDNRVISLNRRSPGPAFALSMLPNPLRPRLGIEAGSEKDHVLPLRYHAPGHGLWHATMLRQLGDWLADRIAAAGPPPDLIVGHKLSIEGIAVRRAAGLLGVPYALSMQGDTDTRITATLRHLRGEFARCFHQAAVVFPFAPWTLARIEAMLGPRAGPSVILPCPIASDTMLPPREGGQGLVSVFHLQSHRRKNLARMAQASDELARAMPGGRLTVFGGGSGADRAVCDSVVRGHPAIDLAGPLPLAQVPGRINRAAGFVLPSLRESFGMVFLEALFAGTPIAYPAGWAVDGYFDAPAETAFALRTDAGSVAAIAEAMARLLREEAPMKRALAAWQQSPAARRFQRATIAAEFARGLALAAGATPAA